MQNHMQMNKNTKNFIFVDYFIIYGLLDWTLLGMQRRQTADAFLINPTT